MKSPSFYNKAAYASIFAIVAITTLFYGAVHQVVIGFAYLMVVFLAVLWASDCVKLEAFKFSVEPIQLILYAAAVYGFVQTIPFGSTSMPAGIDSVARTISIDPFATKVSALHFLILAIYFSVVLTLFSSASRLKKFATFLTVFGAAFAFFAILQSLLSPTKIYGLLERTYAQPFGAFVSRNNYAAWMEMAIAVPMALLFTGSVSKDKHLIIITAVSVMGASLILSGSRGGLVVLVLQLGFLLLLTYSRKKKGSLWLKVALALGLLAGMIAGTAFVGGESTLTRLNEEQAPEASTINRPVIWRVTGRIIADHPILGAGLGAYGVAYTKYDKSSGFERVEQAHNDYLQVLSDAGVVGGILGLAFLALLISHGYRGVRTSNRTRRAIAIGSLTGIFGVLVHSLFDFGLHTMSIAVLFLTLVALLVASGSNYEDDELEKLDGRGLAKHDGRSI